MRSLFAFEEKILYYCAAEGSKKYLDYFFSELKKQNHLFLFLLLYNF